MRTPPYQNGTAEFFVLQTLGTDDDNSKTISHTLLDMFMPYYYDYIINKNLGRASHILPWALSMKTVIHDTPAYVMHRHEDLCLIYVLSDSIFMKALEETIHLSAYEVLITLCMLG